MSHATTTAGRSRTSDSWLARAGGWALTVAVAGGGLVFAVVVVYAVLTVFKPASEVLTVPLRWLPSEWLWANWLEPFRQTAYTRYFLNSVVVGVAVTLLNVLTCSLAGYSFSKFAYPGRTLLFIIVIATLMMPLEVIYVPLFALMAKLDWINTYWGLIIPAGTNAFGIFLLKQSIDAVPDELIESARLDGAGELRILFRIILPLMRGPLAALALFIFMTNWDSLLWPLLVASEDALRTLPVGLAAMQASYATSFPMLMAASVLAMVPTLVLFVALQRRFVQGIAMSAGIQK